MSGEELRAALTAWEKNGAPNRGSLAAFGIRPTDAAPSTPEPSGLHEALAEYGIVTADDFRAAVAEGGILNGRLRAAPSTEPALDAERQFTAVDKSLLATFQWSDKDYKRFGLAASALLRNLHDIGWDVTVSDPEKAAKYARLAESQP